MLTSETSARPFRERVSAISSMNNSTTRRTLLKAALGLAAAPLCNEVMAGYMFRLPTKGLKQSPPGATCAARLLVPAYFWDGAQWDQLATSTPCDVIFNPSSGPYAEDFQLAGGWSRTWFDPKLAILKQRGYTTFGYVATSYGSRPLPDILAEVSAYINSWGVSNFFLDEATATAEGFAFYQALYLQIKLLAPGALLILNPGILSDDLVPYFDLGADIRIVTFENALSEWSARYRPTWHQAYRNRSYALVHGCSTAGLTQVAADAAAEGYRGMYCTDRSLAQNPWAALPSYWSAEKICG